MVKKFRALLLTMLTTSIVLLGCSGDVAPAATPIAVEPSDTSSEPAQVEAVESNESDESTVEVNNTDSVDGYPVAESVDTAYPSSNSPTVSTIDPATAFLAGPNWAYSETTMSPFADAPFASDGKFLYYTNLQSDAQVYMETSEGYSSLVPQFPLSSEADWLSEDRVVFAAQGSNSGNWVLYEKQAANAEPQLLPFDQPRLNWRPSAIDETRLLFLSNRDQNVEIYRFDFGSNLITNVSNSPSNEFDPHFSAETQKILFVSDRNGKNEVFTMDLDGANATVLIEFEHDIFSPRWSPDGQQVTFSALVGDTSQVFVYSIASQTIDRITDNLFDSTTPTWLDNDHIIYSSQSEENKWNVFVADLETNQISQVVFSDPTVSRQYVRWQQ